jgi:hypothetical protein
MKLVLQRKRASMRHRLNGFNDRGLLNADKVKLAHENFDKKDIKNSFYVWQWINMEMWHRIFID